ncbi:hypothetical protein PSH03_005906 [Micromonospora sp. PSH03]|uniref:hypothetical protein n=1 Tax=Micromonospora TaxID=1873 RepID=UPI001EE96B04|nr:hypothetical protein [Micromonospora salmantinae]MCG5460104.1 hypothetical protein [Micromonospora salmantinae]
MRSLGPLDSTQLQLLPELKRTEELLGWASSEASGRSCDAEIVTMPDLGVPHNVRRIHGGFLTGALYRWESSVPFVPVDTTVNLCGVSMFRTNAEFADRQSFANAVERAKAIVERDSSFSWNFDTGNHFVILAEVREDGALPRGRYLVLHASAAEFKKQYNGLYPAPGNWYSDNIRTFQAKDGRYLRYISGKSAENFGRIVNMLESYQRQRQRMCAELVVGGAGLGEEILSVLHYGMPDSNSVAIGCQWLPAIQPIYLLLTRPSEPIYLIEASSGGDNEVATQHGARMLTPHGLGVEATAPLSIQRGRAHLEIAGRRYPLSASLAGQPFLSIRQFNEDLTLRNVLRDCPGRVIAKLEQVFSHHRTGDM